MFLPLFRCISSFLRSPVCLFSFSFLSVRSRGLFLDRFPSRLPSFFESPLCILLQLPARPQIKQTDRRTRRQTERQADAPFLSTNHADNEDSLCRRGFALSSKYRGMDAWMHTCSIFRSLLATLCVNPSCFLSISVSLSPFSSSSSSSSGRGTFPLPRFFLLVSFLIFAVRTVEFNLQDEKRT